MDDYTPVIRKVTQLTGFDKNGRAADQIRVEYMVGNHGPFTEIVAKDGFGPTTVQGLIQKTADTLRALGATSTT